MCTGHAGSIAITAHMFGPLVCLRIYKAFQLTLMDVIDTVDRMAGIEGGEIVQGLQDAGHAVNGVYNIHQSWLERLLFQYVSDITVTDRIRAVIAMECQLGYQYPYDQTAIWDVHAPVFSVYPDRAEAMYTLGKQSRPWLQFGFGYFPFRTNPDVRNLGEYLFRTNTYPVYAMTNFNRPYNRLLGIRAGSTLFDSTLHLDALLTGSNLIPPLADGTLSFLASYRLLHFLDIGGGISFCHLLQVSQAVDTPKTLGVDSYIKANGDTGYYTFAGTKLMARFALDFKPLMFSAGRLFNSSDLRLYGEWCVTGLGDQKNYDTSAIAPHFYDKTSDRMLYMLGLNLPLFRLVQLATVNIIKECPEDVFSIEVEHYPNAYPNSLFNVVGHNDVMYPIPYSLANVPAMANSKIFPWFWSFYFKKAFLDRFALIVQLARDHMKPNSNNVQYNYTGDVLVRQGDWWWNVRLNLNY